MGKKKTKANQIKKMLDLRNKIKTPGKKGTQPNFHNLSNLCVQMRMTSYL